MQEIEQLLEQYKVQACGESAGWYSNSHHTRGIHQERGDVEGYVQGDLLQIQSRHYYDYFLYLLISLQQSQGKVYPLKPT